MKKQTPHAANLERIKYLFRLVEELKKQVKELNRRLDEQVR